MAIPRQPPAGGEGLAELWELTPSSSLEETDIWAGVILLVIRMGPGEQKESPDSVQLKRPKTLFSF